MRWLYKFIYYRVLGWKVTGNTNMSVDNVKKAIIIAVPHTSWHDFYIGILMRGVIGVKANFIAKKELFVGPLGWYLRYLGGAPVDRYSKENTVKTLVELFEKRDEFRVGIAPEGTRKKVTKWKTGFYFIAKKANVPIIMFTLDFAKKENKVSEPFYPTDDMEADFKFMQDFFKGTIGKIPKYS